MNWGEILGAALGGLGVGAMANKWTNLVDDVDTLRMHVRMDIGTFNAGSVEACSNVLKAGMRNAAMMDDREGYRKAYIANEILLEQARQMGIIAP
jgi:hypothetical protein